MILSFIQKIYISENLKKLITNSGWLILDKIIKIIGGFFIGIWVARYLGPKDYGLLNYGSSFVGLFAPLYKLGLDGIVIREITKYPEKAEYILGSAFLMKLIGAIVLIITTFWTAFFLNQNRLFLLIIFIVACSYLFKQFEVFDFWFRANMLNKYSIIAMNIGYIFSLIFKIILIIAGASVICFAIPSVLESFIALIVFLIVFPKVSKIKLSQLKFSFKIARELLKDSWPMIFAGTFAMIFMNIDKVMLGKMIGNKAVGEYSVAVTLSTMFYFIPMALINASFPILVKVSQKTKKHYLFKLRKLMLFLVIFAYCQIVFIWIFGEELIKVLFGLNYIKAVNILFVHILSTLFIYLGLTRGPVIMIENITRIAMISTLIGALVNVILNLLLIPKYSGVGAAIATLISYVIIYVFTNVLWDKTRYFFKMQIETILLIPAILRLRYERNK